MTDTKPTWKRHKACNQRVFNDPIDWEGHLRSCPAILRADFDRFVKRINALEIDERLDALEQTEITDIHDVDEDDEDDVEQQSQYTNDLPDPDIDETEDEPDIRQPTAYLTAASQTDAYGRPIQ